MSNNLINETSPYLLQHKDNPVNWHPWNDHSLSLSAKYNLPILLSVGYSACHWCHVMAHESFEDNNIASFMNKNFINIKLDREERPDIDSLYQTALSIMGQQGGWPLTMFLDTNLRPFWGGTYFPNKRRHGMPSFLDVLEKISEVFKKNKTQVDTNSNAIYSSLNSLFYKKDPAEYNKDEIRQLKLKINSMFDQQNGGLVGAPKFPMVPLLKSLLSISIEKGGENRSCLSNINKTVLSICLGGIYDHLGGGFSRYSTDEFWLAPHFEKMLYDNAQLIELLSIMYTVFPNPIYKNRIQKTFSWLKSEMLFKTSGGASAYYSAIDADSEGEEGKYYVWDSVEIKNILLEEASDFNNEYGIKEDGNWENKNILHRIGRSSVGDFDYEISEKNSLLINKLYDARLLRASPSIDKKVLTDWNSMLVCALVRASFALDDKKYLIEAESVFSYLINNHLTKSGLYHSSYGEVLGQKATIDDYANLIRAALLLYEVGGDIKTLSLSKKLIDCVMLDFYDKNICGFSYSNKNNKDLFIKNTNILDSAAQSGSSLMLENLYIYHSFMGRGGADSVIDEIIKNNWGRVRKNPASYPAYLKAAYISVFLNQVVIISKKDSFGDEVKKLLLRLNYFFTVSFIKEDTRVSKTSPFFGKGAVGGKTTVYICSGFVCTAPILSMGDLKRWFSENTNFSSVFV